MREVYHGGTVKTLAAFGFHDRESPHYWSIRAHMEREGWTVVECHTTAKGFLGKLRDLRRQWNTMRGSVDAVLVTFPGHYLMPFAWMLTRRPRKQLFFEAFVSLYDSDVSDRKRIARWSPFAWFLFAMDYLSCHLADRVFLDTDAHRHFFIRTFHLRPERVAVAYLETRHDLFSPRVTPRETRGTFEVFFYGTYIPLQGVDHILTAAAIAEKKEPRFHLTIVGGGQTYADMQKLQKQLQLRSVTFVPTVPLSELPRMIRNADLCLGIFGTTDKAARVIPHKVVDAVACGVPVLTRDSPAIRERYANHPNVLLCPAGDPQAIATIILDRASRSLEPKP